MATLEMSNDFFYNGSTGFKYFLVNYIDNIYPAWSLLPNGGGAGHQFKIMKGVIPTDFSTLTSNSSRSTDVLITYSRGSTFLVDFSGNPIICNSTFVNATASGTATWFWSASTNQPYYQFIGTIGTTGSGADLEMVDTNIVSGSPYKINNFKIQFPSSWTY